MMCSVIHHYPDTKKDLIQCLDIGNCTIFRKNPKCHVIQRFEFTLDIPALQLEKPHEIRAVHSLGLFPAANP